MKDLNIDVRCPNCGRTMRVRMRDMVPGRSRRCICGCQIRFEGNDGRKVQRALEDVEREIKKLSRTIRIKLW